MSKIEDMLTIGKQILAAQPFSVLLGSELLTWSDSVTEVKIPIKAELKQQNGFVHGGVISYATDTALAYAGGSALGTGVVTSEFKINYVRPAMGDFILARATVIHAGRNQAVCRCEVYACSEGCENLCAMAQGTITKIGQSSKVHA